MGAEWPLRLESALDLSLTKRADYVMRAAISLARHSQDGGYRKIREVSQEMGLPLRYTPQILNLLLKANLAEARAGQRGGYRLLRKPEDVSLLEVVEAAEGPLKSDHCTLSGGPCHWEGMCPLHPVWQGAQDALRNSLASKTLDSVLDIDRRLESGEYPVPPDSHRRQQDA